MLIEELKDLYKAQYIYHILIRVRMTRFYNLNELEN